MHNNFEEPTPVPETTPAPSLWTDRSRIWIVGLIFMLGFGNIFFQVQAYMLTGGLVLPVLAGQLLGVFIPLLVLSRNNGWNPIHDFDLGKTQSLFLASAFVLALAALVPSSLLAELSMRVFPGDPERMAMFQKALPRDILGMILTFITVVLVGPLGEEIVFRGLLHRLAANYWDPLKAGLLASLIFAMVHAEPWLLFGLVGIGAALSFLYQTTGSLLVCWVFHAVHNSVALVMMYSAKEVQTEPSEIVTGDYLLLGISLVVWVLIGSWLVRVNKNKKQ
ncbi:MAG: CPBP family intramembrane metalloprotease [bacterium]|nr:CPBP family intramembrane metalloprotease [bacterium]